MGGQPRSLVDVPGCGIAASKYNGELSSISKILIWILSANSMIYIICRMSLNTMTIVITSPRIYTKLGVPITVTGVAQVVWTWWLLNILLADLLSQWIVDSFADDRWKLKAAMKRCSTAHARCFSAKTKTRFDASLRRHSRATNAPVRPPYKLFFISFKALSSQ